jgi:hypothetical protein
MPEREITRLAVVNSSGVGGRLAEVSIGALERRAVSLTWFHDFRVADVSAVFGLPEVGIGIIPSSGGAYRLSRIVGPARAKELIIL